MSKTLIIQPGISEYRKALFIGLNQELSDLTILHFGDKKSNLQNINEIIGKKITVKGFHFIFNFKSTVKNYDTIIIMLDPHWINILFLPFLSKNKKVVFWGHGLGKSKLLNLIRRKLVKYSHALITYSESGKNNFSDSSKILSKTYVANNTLSVPNSADTSNFQKDYFIYVGRLQKRKNLPLFLEIYKELNLENKLGIRIIGDGELELNALQKKAQHLGIVDSVEFYPGTHNEEELLSHFSKAIAYVSPGDVGLGVLHSFSYGVPVITLRKGNHGPEFSNIVNKVNGLISESKFEMKNDLLNLLESNKMEELGHNAFVHFTTKRSINNTVEGFLNAINHNG